MPHVNEALLTRLFAVATGQIKHAYNGQCPDQVEGPDVRDDECPACVVLQEVEAEVKRYSKAAQALATDNKHRGRLH